MRGERFVDGGPAIPTTLHDSLMARLDRLAPVKEVAQVAAAIGREFSYRLLACVAPSSGLLLQDALAQLAAAEVIFSQGEPPDCTYIFKHALLQDAAYSSLLRGKRQATPRSDCRSPRGPIRPHGRNAAGTHRTSLDASGTQQAGHRLFEKSRSTGDRAVGERRGDRAPETWAGTAAVATRRFGTQPGRPGIGGNACSSDDSGPGLRCT